MAEALHSLANLRRDTGDPAGARALYQRSLAIWSKRFGPEHPIYALGLRDLAVLDLDERRTGTAVGELASVLAIQDSLLGPEHSEVGITLEAYSRALLAAGDSSRAIAAALRCERIGRDYARLTGRALSERQALRSADVRSRGLPVAVAALSRTLPDSVYRSVLDGVIHSRALVLDEMAERRRTLSAMGDSTVDALKTRLRDASRGVAKLLVEGPDQDHPETYRRSIQEAQERLGAAERDLAARSDAFRRLRRGRSIGVDEVESALPRGAALVAFVRSERHERLERPAGDAEYSAFVLSARGTPIAHVRLGSAHRVDALVATWRREAAEGAVRGTGGSDPDSAYRVAGVPLRRCIWDPVARLCRNAGRIFVVPDGALHLVSFAALPTGRRGYVIESGPVIHYLSAERDLVPDPEGAGSRSRRLLAMGGPAFDDRPHAAAPGASYRGTRSSCAEFRSVRFAALPASRAEVRDITARWRRFEPALASAGQGQVATTPTSVELTGTAASEAAFKAEAPRAEVVHLATHGFFIGQSCARASVGARGIGGYGAEAIRRPPREHAEKGSADHQASDSAENPLALSGLALASANNRDSAGPEDEDGILTAEEIAAMDLSGTALVVLSACDTGSGELRAGEGVMGLRRAFHIAGAGSLIMSLWQVEDRSARAWMNSFYESRLRRGGSIDEAVRAAGLELLRSRRASHRSTHPFYWGGFVAEGDWH
jgi:CHAT domain-containing protein